jgi:hypothetical protein
MTSSGENRRKGDKVERRGGKRSTSFKKGQPSANPKGRPKKDFDLVTRCRELTPAIIEHYGKMGASAETAAEVLAGRVVLEYGNDKPRQRTELTGPNGAPLGRTQVLLVLPDDGSGPDEPDGGAAAGG